jgi:hypothetical protein
MTVRASRKGRVLEAAKHRLTTGGLGSTAAAWCNYRPKPVKTGHRAAVPSNRRAACEQVRESVA